MTAINHPVSIRAHRATLAQREAGFSLIELMVAITIGLLLVAGLGALLVNISSANRELAKANSQIENGRFAIQVLQSDIVHAGFWGRFIPQFDDVNWQLLPNDTPTAVPDPCLAYNATNWDFAFKNNLIGAPIQSNDAVPGTCSTATVVPNKKGNTDVLVVRHAATCVPGDTNCDADTAGKLYFQSSACSAGTAGIAQGATATTITLQAASATSNTATVNNAYSGMIIRTTGGSGAGQSRVISTYNGTTLVATVTLAWTTTPDSTTTYTIVENLLDTSGFSLKKRGADCSTAAAADKRKFVSNIYYIRDYATTVGDAIPTLMRSSFDPAGPAALAHQPPEALVEGIEGFAVELGIDNAVTRCGAPTSVNYAAAVDKINPSTCALDANAALNTLPTNRGDGNPDTFIRCTTAAPCTAAQLTDVVAVKLYVLVRATETTPGYTDSKTYCLGAIDSAGSCPAANNFGPFGDGYKRHLFANTVRLTNISGRRETP
jgi:prepilin-type N-terminal cleavage/methylation domain-containing protein